MGLLDKVVLLFDDVFWDDDSHLFGRVSPQAEWAEWLNLTPLTGAPMLMGFNAGSVAQRFARTDEAAVIASAVAAIETMLR
jgi:hypothetical protein